jgi:transposase
LVVCRFIRSGSNLKVFEYWQDNLYPPLMVGKDELHHIYRALDLLCQHKEEVEQSLFWFNRDLLSMDVDVVLYDLTTLRFESTREDLGELRRFGYSKERRSDCTQVVLGLLVDTQGIPLGFEVYPGNTFEGQTLEDIVSRLRHKFHVRRFIFVADRGLFSAKNLKHIRQICGEHEAEGGEFIVGMKLGVFKQREAEFYNRAHFHAINEELSIYETTHQQDRCIITWSKARAERDYKAREDILSKIAKKLNGKKNNTKKFVSNTNYRKYLDGLDQGQLQLNQKAIDEATRKDGFFGVVINVKDMSAAQVVTAYKNLWIIEDAFGEIKGNLKARPVFHWSDERIVGHLTLCFLAYFCEAHMTKLLREHHVELESAAISEGIIKQRALTVVESMRELADVRAIPVKMKGKTFWLRTDIKGNAAHLFKLLGVRIPPKLLTVAE